MSRKATNDSGPRFKAFVDYLVYLFARLAEEGICLIPGDHRALAFGRFLGRLAYMLARDRRQVTIDNLTIAFGDERTREEIEQLSRKNFEHLGMMGVEMFRLRRWSQEETNQRLVVGGTDTFNVAWAPGRDGLYYVTAHFGSFEVLAALSKLVGARTNVMATGLKNKFVSDRVLFSRGGGGSGVNIIPHQGVVHKVIEMLKAGETVLVLADQRGDDTRPVWVDFFGRKVLANGIFARFAIDSGARCFPLYGLRLDDGKYLCHFGEEIPIQITDDRVDDIQVNSQRLHNVFEAWLREYPEQGFWMHRKFKRKPKKRRKKKR
ncbi:lysophospholipid acyltransferase family protein [Thermodesulfobacteriota bacterium]